MMKKIKEFNKTALEGVEHMKEEFEDFKKANEDLIEYLKGITIDDYNELKNQILKKEAKKEDFDNYAIWEERVLDNLERWVKYNEPITRKQAEETCDFINEQDNIIFKKDKEIEKLQEDIGNYVNIVLHDRKEIDRLNNVINELETYIIENSFGSPLHNCSVIESYKVLDKLQELKGSDKE